jgi:hypothetical protein
VPTAAGLELDLTDSLGGYEQFVYSGPSSPEAVLPKFAGVISICFGPYMRLYCEAEEQNLKETAQKLVAEDSWSESAVLQSSILLFNAIKQKFTKCASFDTTQTLYGLTQVFRKALNYYSSLLEATCPGTSVVD